MNSKRSTSLSVRAAILLAVAGLLLSGCGTTTPDALVRRGIPFRVAHHVVGSLVAQAEEARLGLDQVPDSMIGLALGGGIIAIHHGTV